jgi:hypothetical protein
MNSRAPGRPNPIIMIAQSHHLVDVRGELRGRVFPQDEERSSVVSKQTVATDRSTSASCNLGTPVRRTQGGHNSQLPE